MLGLLIAITLIGCAGGAINWNQEPPYSLVQTWGEKGSGAGQFNDPTGVAVTDTEVFVSDARNGRIQVFDHQGRFKRKRRPRCVLAHASSQRHRDRQRKLQEDGFSLLERDD